MSVRLICADVFAGLASLPDESVNCVVTSPPYWALRHYDNAVNVLGCERDWKTHLSNLGRVFAEVHRVLRRDGTLFVNYSDKWVTSKSGNTKSSPDGFDVFDRILAANETMGNSDAPWNASKWRSDWDYCGLPLGSACALPERFCLQMMDFGWVYRQKITWRKLNPFPHPPNRKFVECCEPIFFFVKSFKNYHFDADAVRKMTGKSEPGDGVQWNPGHGVSMVKTGGHGERCNPLGSAHKAYIETGGSGKGSHPAAFHDDMVRPLILAGCPKDGVVLDPFTGSCTTLMVAAEFGRDGIGIDVSREYLESGRSRIGLLADVSFEEIL